MTCLPDCPCICHKNGDRTKCISCDFVASGERPHRNRPNLLAVLMGKKVDYFRAHYPIAGRFS